MSRLHLVRFLRMAALAASATAVVSALGQSSEIDLSHALKWRNIGPFRGGRVSAVCGIPGNAATFYMGLPQGGVWKTTSSGQVWTPVFDSVTETSEIGAIGISPARPNTLYVGTGEISGDGFGGDIGGKGVFRSDDGGSTWRSLGLEKTAIVPSLLVDPHNADIVLAAAMGSPLERSPDRGVFRTVDGGKTWSRTLAIDTEIGAQHLAWAFDNPSTVFASVRNHYRGVDFARRDPSASGGCAIYKSTDEGLTWKKLGGKGLPALVGRFTLAVAQGTASRRVYVIGMFGLYRSDDGGDTWRKMAGDDRRIANGQGNYSSGVAIDPKDPDTLYTLATCVYRSTDGGKTFDAFKGSPGGDDPQHLWIDPLNGSDLLLGGDQGAVISLDAGRTWSSWYNQPTGQFYHIDVSNEWPYWIFGTQQDSGSIGTSSRGNLGEITPFDWTPHPGSEGGPMLVDPLDPHITYCQGAGGLVRVSFPTMQWTAINPPSPPDTELRGGPNIVFSSKNPRELLCGFQKLMASTDRGSHWRNLSPDLAVREDAKPPARGQTNPNRLGTIQAIGPSPIDGGLIWIGTSNGMIKLTRNHGETWADVSIAGLPGQEKAGISSIAASPTRRGEAYATAVGIGANDFKPHVYRTLDFGKSWSAIDKGLPTDGFGRNLAFTIRCDSRQAGLVFLVTGGSVYFSSDDGEHWRSLRLNLPTTSFNDLVVHGNDLVLATYGRGNWILDDFSPLRSIDSLATVDSVHLLKPEPAIRVRRNLSQDTPLPPEVPHAKNPPLGAVIDYWLGAKPGGTVSIDVLDRSNSIVRHFTSSPPEPYRDPKPAVPDLWFEPRLPLPTEAGLNRITWNLRYDSPPAFFHDPSYIGGATEHDTPFAVEGPLVPPGSYRVRLTVDGKTVEAPLVVVNDPRSPGSQRGIEAAHRIQMQLYAGVREAWDGYHNLAALREEIGKLMATKPVDDVQKAAKALDDKLAALAGSTKVQDGFFIPQSTTDFVGMDAFLLGQLDSVEYGDFEPSEGTQFAAANAWVSLTALSAKYRESAGSGLAGLNQLLTKHGMKPIAPAPKLTDPPAPPVRYVVRTAPAKTIAATPIQ